MKRLSIVIFGAGSVGMTLAAGIDPEQADVYVVAREGRVEELSRQPICVYKGGSLSVKRENLKVISSVSEVQAPTVVVLTVKNYDLVEACEAIKPYISDETLIVGFQNGVENQTILPRYFKRIIYGIVQYNAWRISPWAWRYNSNGPTILGTPDNRFREDSKFFSCILSPYTEGNATLDFQSEAHHKLVSNLVNSVTTLIGNTQKDPRALHPLHQIVTRHTLEGMKTIRAAGYQHSRYSNIPSMPVLALADRLPHSFTRKIFKRKLEMVGQTSMATDILEYGKGLSELETINGYLVELAAKFGVDAPLSENVLNLCRERFKLRPFRPLAVGELLESIWPSNLIR